MFLERQLGRFWIAAGTLVALSNAVLAAPVGVVSKSNAMPPKEAVWHGDSPHIFLGGQATLFCGSHGTFSGQSDPPESVGVTKTITYGAVFKGELKLAPPLVSQSLTYSLEEPIRMVERITARRGRGQTRNYSTELTAVVFNGSGLPRNVSIRESPNRRSTGKASIAAVPRGNFRIQSVYEVWLEISVDGGRTWHLASEAVSMSLMPNVKKAKILAIPNRKRAPQ